MTGLDLKSDLLIEIAVLVTDSELNVLGDGVDVVIHAGEAALSSMVDVVTQMHARSGLIEEVRASTVDVPTAEEMVLDYVRSHVKQAKTAPLAGNSIATDRGFIARDMPKLDDFLHYRMIDVSSIKELCRRWYPRIYFGQPEKGLAHRALADIHESIRELQVLPPNRVRGTAGSVDQRHRHGCGRAGSRLGARFRAWIRSTRAPAASIDHAAHAAMVAVVQLVEHQVVILGVAGSSPVSHPNSKHRPTRNYAGGAMCFFRKPGRCVVQA